MPKLIDVNLPKLGESIHEATVVQWLKQEGDFVALDEPLLEVATDKVNSEIPSPQAGVLKQVLVAKDERVTVGAPLAKLDVEGQGSVSANKSSTPVKELPKEKEPQQLSKKRNSFCSPAVLRIAELEGIPLTTLEQIKGTGAGGRVSKKDLEKYLASRGSAPEGKDSKVSKDCFQGYHLSEREELIPMSAMRKAIADNMVKSFYQAPHASLVAEVDVSDIMAFIKKEKECFAERFQTKLTITSFVIAALSKAAQKFPLMNSTVQDQEMILVKHYVNIGIAVSVEQGLVVPVLKETQKRTMASIASGVVDLSVRARSGRLFPEDVAEGTMTLTNFGMSGVLLGTPILRYPEVAIVGTGAIQTRLVVRKDGSYAPRNMMYLSLTFDHRVIDGMYGCAFLNELKKNLEDFPLQSVYED